MPDILNLNEIYELDKAPTYLPIHKKLCTCGVTISNRDLQEFEHADQNALINMKHWLNWVGTETPKMTIRGKQKPNVDKSEKLLFGLDGETLTKLWAYALAREVTAAALVRHYIKEVIHGSQAIKIMSDNRHFEHEFINADCDMTN